MYAFLGLPPYATSSSRTCTSRRATTRYQPTSGHNSRSTSAAQRASLRARWHRLRLGAVKHGRDGVHHRRRSRRRPGDRPAFAATGADLLLLDICADVEGCPIRWPRGTISSRRRSDCRRLGARVVAVPADVRKRRRSRHAVSRCRDELGPVDVLVNNAGIVGPAGVPAHELDEEAWDVMLAIDLTGPWRCAKAVLPDLIARRRGAIVNVASTAGLVAFPHFANYVAAKHGLIGLTRALALDYAPYGIRVNAVAPDVDPRRAELASGMLRGVAGMLGWVSEDYEVLSLPHHPLGSLVSAADVSGAIVWLASDAAAQSRVPLSRSTPASRSDSRHRRVGCRSGQPRICGCALVAPKSSAGNSKPRSRRDGSARASCEQPLERGRQALDPRRSNRAVA